jgi:hypothetical protein
LKQKVRERSRLSFVNIAENACAAGVFVIHTRHARCADRVIAHQRGCLKTSFADSESQILAMKIFSCLPRRRQIATRQNRFSCESRTADSQERFSIEAIDRCEPA